MIQFTVDQYGVIRKDDDGVLTVVPLMESNPLYEEMMAWRETNGGLVQVTSTDDVHTLQRYKDLALEDLALFMDEYVLSMVRGIPESEVASFEAKARDALQYVENGIPIPQHSAIYVESNITDETVDALCAAIIYRYNRTRMVNGVIAGCRRVALWAIRESTTREQVDSIVIDCKTRIKQMLGV